MVPEPQTEDRASVLESRRHGRRHWISGRYQSPTTMTHQIAVRVGDELYDRILDASADQPGGTVADVVRQVLIEKFSGASEHPPE